MSHYAYIIVIGLVASVGIGLSRLCLAIAVLVAVIRADNSDLPAMVQAIMKISPRDDASDKRPLP